MATATRELTFFLAEPERRLLRAIAARLPGALHSDHLTVLGVLGATGAGVAYALSVLSPAWLWAASALLVVNWLGDSLDGTLARVRRHERPRYGYYIDHLVDAYATVAVGLGLGLSPYVDLGIALGAVVLYLVLSINVYLESTVFGAFRLGYGRFGPTEARLILIAANVALALAGSGGAGGAVVSLAANVGLALLTLGMLGMLVIRFVRNLDVLGRAEPYPVGARVLPGRLPGSGEGVDPGTVPQLAGDVAIDAVEGVGVYAAVVGAVGRGKAQRVACELAFADETGVGVIHLPRRRLAHAALGVNAGERRA
jgi:archaetidylinositol phosphate synthase